MTLGRYNLVVYLGSGEQGRRRRERLEKEARAHGYTRNGRVTLAPYILDTMEGNLRTAPVKNTKEPAPAAK